MIVFVTFGRKLDKQLAHQILMEIRSRFPGHSTIFTTRPPAGRKTILHIQNELVILTFPYSQQESTKEEKEIPQQGFKLQDLIKENKNK
jgi:hypothetical protein